LAAVYSRLLSVLAACLSSLLTHSIDLPGNLALITRTCSPACMLASLRTVRRLFEQVVRRSPRPLQANGPKKDAGFPRRNLPFCFPRAASPMAVAWWRQVAGRCTMVFQAGRCGDTQYASGEWHPFSYSSPAKTESLSAIDTMICRLRIASLCHRWTDRGLFSP